MAISGDLSISRRSLFAAREARDDRDARVTVGRTIERDREGQAQERSEFSGLVTPRTGEESSAAGRPSGSSGNASSDVEEGWYVRLQEAMAAPPAPEPSPDRPPPAKEWSPAYDPRGGPIWDEERGNWVQLFYDVNWGSQDEGYGPGMRVYTLNQYGGTGHTPPVRPDYVDDHEPAGPPDGPSVQEQRFQALAEGNAWTEGSIELSHSDLERWASNPYVQAKYERWLAESGESDGNGSAV
ncbi:MAG: hypothetical protein FJ144_03505 [Deltaproteobacteria bacterium]|nr:hypothetical protein [Deltaproteobacteria bacterium]